MPLLGSESSDGQSEHALISETWADRRFSLPDAMNNIPLHNDVTGVSANSRENLRQLLSQLVEYPDRRAEITEIIENTFGDNRAVLVLDMSGFSRTTQRLGIISFLSMIHQMQSICGP